MLTILIMAGGSGERFWPLSTPKHPKQVLSIFTGKPMIKDTVDRITPLVPIDKIFIATNKIQKSIIEKALPELPKENIIIEPLFKDTAAAIGYGIININKKFPNSITAVLASDHVITDPKQFRENLNQAYNEAKNTSKIITLGINPTRPEIGYGYIEVQENKLNTLTKVLSFKEKPNYDKACEYLESKKYLWNSGMFIFSYKTIMNAFEKHSKKHYQLFLELQKTAHLSEITNLFNQFEKISIDYAIMEKYDQIEVIPTSFGWSDVGDFNALNEFYKSDTFNNVDVTKTTVFVDSNNNIIISDNHKAPKVSLLGINNAVIVVTKENILIANRSETQRIKEIIKKRGN